MSQNIKLVWDFHGTEAKQIADHHARHLLQFAEKENLSLTNSGIESVTTNHYYAYLDVIPEEMIKVRDALKPNRGLQIED